MKEINEVNKEKKQVNLEEYIKNLEDHLKEGFSGVITIVNEMTNKTFFKDSGTFDEKDGIAITVKLKEDETVFNVWYSKPKLRGYEQSNIYLFKRKYGCLPKENLEVECIIDENGFFKIKL